MRGIDVLNASQAEAERVTAALLQRLPNVRRGISRAAVENLSSVLNAYAREARLVRTAASDKAASISKDTSINVAKEAAKSSMLMARDRSSEQALARAITGTAAASADDRLLSLKDVRRKVLDAKSGPLAFKSLGKDFALGLVYNYLQKHPNDKVAVLGLLLEGGISVATSLSGGPVAVAFSLAFVIDKAVNELGERWVRSVEQDFERQFTDTVLQSYLKIHADTKADLNREIQMLERATIAGIIEHDTTYFSRGFGEVGKLFAGRNDGNAAVGDMTRQEAARLAHNMHVFISLTIRRFAYAATAAWMAEQTALVMARHYGEAAQLCAELANTSVMAKAHEELTHQLNAMLHSPGYKGVMKLPERSNIFRAWSREYDQSRDQFIELRLRIVDDLNVFLVAIAELLQERPVSR